jgi:hypothetical protein
VRVHCWVQRDRWVPRAPPQPGCRLQPGGLEAAQDTVQSGKLETWVEVVAAAELPQ